ncbi:MAG: glycosyltransferase family 2 protein [Bacteroidia bacterium]|jgi:cellulose synthase/poly-beta-1,6-N-acetylglucosamine synthase-like glycosyltransferase|nr:glycosyltransferase family 2 protein [Bacteroidia bacterium]
MKTGTYIELVGEFYEGAVFVYGTTLLLIYALLAVLSLSAVRRFQKLDSHVDYSLLLNSKLTPGISVIAPAFNESLTIIENVHSLLNLNYPKYEVIIVNDGSTDDSLEKMVREFDLVEVDFAYNERLKTKPIKRIFKSSNPAYNKLTIVDKVNGKAKADASNAGINASSFDYFICTDVDSILDRDTIMKLVKPVMDDSKKRIIATGATLRMANSCVVEQGFMQRVVVPNQLLPRFQEIEYIRSFVMGKMGWSVINCVPNVSGGLGMFDKEIAINAGGYDPQSFGEDMELVIRMMTYCINYQINYAIRYIPITLCWTEGPATIKVYGRQRARWARGLAQLMWQHRKLVFNPNYGRLGMIVMPYNFVFELLAPIVEALGIIYYIVIIFLDAINWDYAILLLVFVYTYAIMISTLSILWDQITYQTYKTSREIITLCLTAFFEMVVYHPLIVFYSIKGYYNFLGNRKHTWGNMQRQGFGQGGARARTVTATS